MVQYKNLQISKTQLDFIRDLITSNPTASRRKLSQLLCVAWDWRQANGSLRDMYCRSVMLHLHRLGHICLPERKRTPPNPLAKREIPPRIIIDKTPIIKTVSEMCPLEIKQVRGSKLEPIYKSLVAEYHYLGYCHPIGEHLKYIVYWNNRPISCLAFSSAPRHIGARDKYIGWDKEIRTRNISLIAYNTRFLILPWVKVSCLASHILSRMVKILPLDWQGYYKHPIYFLETFVDTERFLGTCYKAANWRYLGLTTGRGKNAQTHKPNRSIKAVWGYPLHKHFRKALTQWN